MLKIEVNKGDVDTKLEGSGEKNVVRAELIMANIVVVDTYSSNFDIPFENAAMDITRETIAAYRKMLKMQGDGT